MTEFANGVDPERQGYQDLTNRDDEIAAYMRNRKSSVRTKTWRQHGTALRHFRDFIDERNLSPGDLVDDDADDLVNWFKAKDAINDQTAKAYLGRISHMYDYAIRRRRSNEFSDIDYNPIAIVIEDESFEEDGTSERREIGHKVMREAVQSIHHPLLLCMVVLLLKTGIRAGELVNIDMRDVHLDHHWAKEHFPECRENLEKRPDTLYIAPRSEMEVGNVVNGEERKDPNKRKRGTYIPIDKELKSVMLLWLAIRPPSRSPAEPFFTLTTGGRTTIPGDRLRSDYVWSKITDWAQEQGWWSSDATLESNVSPHYFRHYFRTIFGRKSGDELLVKYLRGDKGEAMDDYMHYWGDNVREPYLQSIYKLF
ncbi:site-specific integrase/recombinase [Haloterrigena salina JCM 13891]|uniref:Site-specific integrase/recombinase n=1 Tax=Haloterrigena salina JCM 13891 TaxID=1227488 RepID=M0CH13_9EURY|nr:tyrosine-type recombinase/integrase [Haloterrigena salina]ELZ22536.1 site-specific integrase/recombinase [Haloterrigena salina JCM 13891]